jgi:hypothetical protein
MIHKFQFIKMGEIYLLLFFLMMISYQVLHWNELTCGLYHVFYLRMDRLKSQKNELSQWRAQKSSQEGYSRQMISPLMTFHS